MNCDFYLTHLGTIYSSRNAVVLWDVLKEMNVGLRIVGDIDRVVEDTTRGIDVKMDGHVPHERAMQIMVEAPVLLLLVNNCFVAKATVPGKIFEYMAAQRPILGIGPSDGESAELLRKTATGVMIDFNDSEGMRRFILSCKNWME